MKLLWFGAAIAVGYLLMSAVRSLRAPADGQPPPHAPARVAEPSPEFAVAQSAAGAGIPADIQARLLGQSAPPPRPSGPTEDPKAEPQPNYGLVIGTHLQEQIDAMKHDLRFNPDMQHQEDGVTIESLDQMAREGRMAW